VTQDALVVQDDDLRLDPFWQEKIPHFGTTRLGSGESPALRRMLLASKSFPVGETFSQKLVAMGVHALIFSNQDRNMFLQIPSYFMLDVRSRHPSIAAPAIRLERFRALTGRKEIALKPDLVNPCSQIRGRVGGLFD
jgi:hypothetical protein